MTLDLNCANFSDDNKSKAPIIPPDGLKKHPVKLNRSAIKEAAEKLGKLVIVAYGNTEADLAKIAATKASKKGKSENTGADMTH